MKCKICQGNYEKVFTLKVLDKYPVCYFQCNNCDFISTENAFWLEEAYSKAILDLDTGILQRNLDLSNVTMNIIDKNFDSSSKFLDYGGGYGIFVRLMRDKGYDFYRYDKYCENLFARYFDIGNNLEKFTDKFELLTAFEVFEHLENPLSEIDIMFKLSDTIFFTTALIPENIKDLKEWWYFAPEGGQHISFYSRKSLEKISNKFKAAFYSDGFNHILTYRRMGDPFLGKDRPTFDLVIKICERIYKILSPRKFLRINKSLTWQDFEYIRQQIGQKK